MDGRRLPRVDEHPCSDRTVRRTRLPYCTALTWTLSRRRACSTRATRCASWPPSWLLAVSTIVITPYGLIAGPCPALPHIIKYAIKGFQPFVPGLDLDGGEHAIPSWTLCYRCRPARAWELVRQERVRSCMYGSLSRATVGPTCLMSLHPSVQTSRLRYQEDGGRRSHSHVSVPQGTALFRFGTAGQLVGLHFASDQEAGSS
jgi:hypothetical protein